MNWSKEDTEDTRHMDIFGHSVNRIGAVRIAINWCGLVVY